MPLPNVPSYTHALNQLITVVGQLPRYQQWRTMMERRSELEGAAMRNQLERR